jgi:hypothetical protein
MEEEFKDKAIKYYRNHLLCVSNYQKRNKDKINTKMKSYYERNRDEIIKRSKEYYQNNKDAIKQKRRMAKIKVIQEDEPNDLNKLT